MYILLINQSTGPEYGQSLIYHGLRKLGHHVVDYPYNHTFHFRFLKNCTEDCANGPCTIPGAVGCLNHPAHLNMIYLDTLLYEDFDLVISNNGIGHERLHRALHNRGIPIAALDLGDSAQHAWQAWKNVVGSHDFHFFRREYLPGQPGNPLPYSFYDMTNITKTSKKENSIAFLYRPTNTMRQQFAVEMMDFPDSVIGEVPHWEYINAIANSKFAVAIRGAGWDTLRYWEIPSLGAVLCRMPSPIVIPNDFEDGINCVEFNNIAELKDKVNFYLRNDDEYEKLRKNSIEHFQKYHTTEARAQQLLDIVFN